MIAVVTNRVSGSVRTCSSLSIWPPNSSDLNPVDYVIWVPFSRWSTIVKVSSQLTNWNERLSRHGRNYRNRSSTRASVNDIVVWSDCVVRQPADTLNSCSTDIRHLLRLLSFTLFSKVDSNKLRINLKNKMTLTDAKFDANLINISEVTSRKTKWPRFFWPTYIVLLV